MAGEEKKEAEPQDDRVANRGKGARVDPSWVRRDHFLATVIASALVVLTGGGYGVNSISSKLDAQTKEIVELRLALTELQAERKEADRTTARNDEALMKIFQQVGELKQQGATQAVQLSEHERRLAALEKGK